MSKNRDWKEIPGVSIPGTLACHAYTSGPLRVIISFDGPDEDRRWHFSISRADRYPSWDEIADARYDLLPHNIDMCMFLPMPHKYLNYQNFCFHLWEVKDPWLPNDEGVAKPRMHENGSVAKESRAP